MEDIGKENKKKSSGCGCLMALVIVLSIFLTWISPSHDREKEQEHQDVLAAFVYSQQYVKEKLKSPSTAQFAGIGESHIQKIDQETYKITSFVDAQNSFGATLRTNYVIIMKKNGSIWGVEKLEFNR